MCIFFLVILVAFGPCLDIYDMCIMLLGGVNHHAEISSDHSDLFVMFATPEEKHIRSKRGAPAKQRPVSH